MVPNALGIRKAFSVVKIESNAHPNTYIFHVNTRKLFFL